MDLQVYFMARRHRERKWSFHATEDYDGRVVPAREVPFGGHDDAAYVLTAPLPGLRETDVLVLGGWEAPAYWQAALQARTRGVKTVAFAEFAPGTSRFESQSFPGRARRFFYRSADAVLSAGAASTQVLENWGIRKESITTGFNSVEVDSLRRSAIGARNGRRHAGHRFLYVGRLIDRKNVALILKEFGRVATESDELWIVGDGPLRGSLEEVASRQANPGQIRFFGAVPPDQLALLYGSCDTLVLVSSAETWGMVVNEALVSGLHVVLAPHVGATASVRGMRGVFVVDDRLGCAMVRSRQSWTGAIEAPEILDFGPDWSAKCSLDAINHALGV